MMGSSESHNIDLQLYLLTVDSRNVIFAHRSDFLLFFPKFDSAMSPALKHIPKAVLLGARTTTR